jgi:hypothetical protein
MANPIIRVNTILLSITPGALVSPGCYSFSVKIEGFRKPSLSLKPRVLLLSPGDTIKPPYSAWLLYSQE